MPKSRKYDGVVYRRKETPFWWIRYRDRSGARRRESTLTKDWQEAQQMLRERLQARDNNVLDVIRRGEKLSLGCRADFFLEKLLETTHASREDTRSKSSSNEAPQERHRYTQIGRSHGGPYRDLPT